MFRAAVNVLLARLKTAEDSTAAQIYRMGNCLYVNQPALNLCAGVKNLPGPRFSGVELPRGSVRLFP